MPWSHSSLRHTNDRTIFFIIAPPVWLFWSGATGYPTSKGAAVTKLCRDNWDSSAVIFAIIIIETSPGNTIFVTPLLTFRKIFLEHRLIVACLRSVRQFYIFHFMMKTNYAFFASSQMRWGNRIKSLFLQGLKLLYKCNKTISTRGIILLLSLVLRGRNASHLRNKHKFRSNNI